MNWTEVTLNTPISVDYEEELVRRVYFASEAITDFKIVKTEQQITGVSIKVPTAHDGEKAKSTLIALVETDLANHPILPQKITWHSRHKPTTTGTVFEELEAMGEATEMGKGLIAIGCLVMQLQDRLDQLLQSIAVDEFGAMEYRYPTLIATETLRRADYFSSFPQFLMFVTRLHNDTRTYQAFQKQQASGGATNQEILDHCFNLDYCLPPTMCYHTFQQLEGSRVADAGSSVVTSVGKSFRFESRYAKTLERLWDFTIREIVFLGDQADVLASREAFMKRSFQLIEDLGLAGHCEAANDPFFCSGDAASKVFSQRLMELKYELRLPIDSDQTIAAASFNYHSDHFGSCFEITENAGQTAQAAHTACVGFGLERLTFAVLSQHGTDRNDWPDILRSEVTSR